jgi:hypothetical protein
VVNFGVQKLEKASARNGDLIPAWKPDFYYFFFLAAFFGAFFFVGMGCVLLLDLLP